MAPKSFVIGEVRHTGTAQLHFNGYPIFQQAVYRSCDFSIAYVQIMPICHSKLKDKNEFSFDHIFIEERKKSASELGFVSFNSNFNWKIWRQWDSLWAFRTRATSICDQNCPPGSVSVDRFYLRQLVNLYEKLINWVQ